ncbi:hypothetical protein HQ346_13980 [Rhodococcus sp. BP-252]|nr:MULTISPECIES: hypothetical protein [Rhodococcus]MBY6412673.1 hypothetical protein [Rhodococcus sp. BP-320]MBY6417529.1 hypothetical protein [Rhodococcus sp. BP-321]MBY6421693.1 hypothetical protein [Rhodococcus sp. BP-324]MBY6427432.1 hypothetical protein [Rhodococcus sp. BP-323]MBY6432717.1 hypothetical protein [Rhodococcus sp. BP-322]
MKQPDEGNLFTDLMEFGPAPTMAREVVVVVISIALFGVVFALVGPTVLLFVAAAVAAVFLGVRFAIGLRGWSRS